MSIPSPYKNPNAVGFVTVGGSRLPGVLTSLTVPARVYEFAVQNGYGQSKVTIYKALGLLESIKLVHFLRPSANGARDDFEILQDFMKFLIPGWPNNLIGRPKAYPIVHPALQWLGAKRVHLTSFSWPEQMAPGDPSRWYELTFQEDQPQKIIPAGPPEPAKINGPPKPQDVNDLTNLQLLATFKGVSVESLFATPAVPTTATATGSAQ